MRLVIAVAAIAVTAIAGFGIWQLGEDEEGPPELAPPSEIADPVLGLPRGWTKTANEAGGFALGVPPGWSAKAAGAKTTLKSPGSGVVVRRPELAAYPILVASGATVRQAELDPIVNRLVASLRGAR